ncbi:MAG TPA: DUF1501 domain-containing protein [Gemmataceae bacterium]|nr:DUF1501 domain-containing protein [Gemmataceae bacterium]
MFRRHEPAPTRRELLRLAAAGVAGSSLSGWLGPLAARATGKSRKACILLWMDGGPSHHDTFDPKPDAAAEIRGELKAIDTAVPGIRVTEKFPTLAGLMKDCAVLRGMRTEEPDHGRARLYMHTGYRPGIGGVDYPVLGSVASAEIGDADSALPNFVVTGTPLNKYEFVTTPGYLGPRHQAMALADPAQGLENLRPLASDFDDRVGVLEEMERAFARKNPATPVEAHRTMVARTVRLIRSEKAKAFDLSKEPAAARDAYGDTGFGRGCLLARRLVEAGIPFVEVYLTNWDTHEKRAAEAAKGLMDQVDRGMGTLLRDLKERGLLDSTLVIWMGEFGRTPRVNRNGGRDHFSRAWTTFLAGGGIRGGQTFGKTDRDGASVTERPVSARDFMATVCRALGIDYAKTIDTPGGRPVKIVEKGAEPLSELFG